MLLAGDSISFGYGPQVKRILGGVFDVENLPENGGTSASLLTHIDEWMIRPKFHIIHLNCGLHDLAVRKDVNEHRVPLEKYVVNVEEIVQRLRKETSSVTVWATITPVIEEWHHIRKDFDRHESDVQSYNKAALEIMYKLKVPINDLHEVVEDAGIERCISEDGVHMNDFGYDLLAKAVVDILLSLKNAVD